ncbi:MAG TPA: hypothetical protein VFV20_04665 [Candidatus Limnocylindria bacterium]|nr:hypothetical protein [Candidatus Limnocylindria bacterium]
MAAEMDVTSLPHATLARTDHRCVIGMLVHRVAAATDPDRPSLVADALDRMLRSGHFEGCCVPRYLALAPERAPREVQIPIDKSGDVAARVIVWPIGSRDTDHPHTDGWTVFVPVRGELATIERTDDGSRVAALAPRQPIVLRPEEGIRHLVRNAGSSPALSIHVSGRI